MISNAREGVSPRPAFTLIELILTVALVGVLLTLLLPSLSHVRDRARQVQSLSNLRSHVSVFSAYANDWDDQFPYFTHPHADWTVLRIQQRGTALRTRYFSAHAVWNYALGEDYYDGNIYHSSFYPPDYPQGTTSATRTGPTQYHYSCSFLADPSFWRFLGRTSRSQLRPMRITDVTYTSRKALFVAHYPYHLKFQNERVIWRKPGVFTEVGFVDGSARAVGLPDLLPGFDQGDRARFLPHQPHVGDFPFGLHTVEGVRGRDVP